MTEFGEEHEDFEVPDEDWASMAKAFESLMTGVAVEGMLMQGMQAALNEFVNIRWPHMLRHEVATEEDGDNPFTGGATAAFISLIEIRALDDQFSKMLEEFDLPDELCAFASFVRSIREATDQAVMHQKLQDGAVIPPDPSQN